MQNNKLKGKIILLITAIIWGFAFVAQEKVSGTIGAFTLNAIRCLMGAFVLLPFIMIKDLKEKKKKVIKKKIIINNFFLLEDYVDYFYVLLLIYSNLELSCILAKYLLLEEVDL